MAAPIAGFVQLPSDSGNTGKKIRTQSRVVGADTVHEHFFVLTYPRDVRGMFYGHSGRLTVQASAHGALAGFMWLVNQAATGVRAAVRRLKFMSGPTAVTAFASSPRITVERVTFTGTPSGATITPAFRDSTDTTNACTLRTASTGMSLTAGATVRGWMVPCVMTAVGTGIPVEQVWEPVDDLGETIIREGEGLVWRQPDAGTTSDTRLAICDVSWLEYNP